MSEIVERVARAMATEEHEVGRWQPYTRMARAAIAAIEQTHVIISKEEYERINK